MPKKKKPVRKSKKAVRKSKKKPAPPKKASRPKKRTPAKKSVRKKPARSAIVGVAVVEEVVGGGEISEPGEDDVYPAEHGGEQ